jgi:putative ABC transport system permease protein
MGARLDRFRLLLALALVSIVRFIVPRRQRAAWLAEWRAELSYLSSMAKEGPRGEDDRRRQEVPLPRRPGVLAHSLHAIPHAAAYLRQEWSPDTLSQDLRYAARRLVKAPAFTAVAMLTIAVGVGANTAIFSIIDSTLIHPLPYADGDRLVYMWKQMPGREFVTTPNVEDIRLWRERATSFEEMQVYAAETLTLTGGDEPRDILSLRVLAGFFGFLGVQPAVGREFSEEEARLDAHVAILGHGLWQSYFGGAEDVLGRTLVLNGEPYTVVGVMRPDFHFQAPFNDAQLWLPLSVQAADEHASPFAMGRLKRGVSREAANEELAALAAGVEDADGEVMWPGKVMRPQDLQPESFHVSLLVFQAAVGMVLLIACANVANLLVARGIIEGREMALRAALGAGRARLFRQLLTEHLLLALGGGLLGYGLARVGVAAIVWLRPEQISSLTAVRIDGWIFFFAMGLAALTGVTFGVIPAIHGSRPDLSSQLDQAARSVSAPHRRSWLRNGLVAAEVALAVILLVGAGLLLGSLVRLMNADMGFDVHNILRMSVSLPEEHYSDEVQLEQFRQQLEARIRQVAGDRLVGIATSGGALPTMGVWISTFAAEGEDPLPAFTEKIAYTGSVSPEFFTALGVPLVDGRDFVADDLDHPDEPVIVNATWARLMWGDERSAGRRIVIDRGDEVRRFTVVGVIDDAKLTGPAGTYGELQIYRPGAGFSHLGLLIRTTGDPLPLIGPIKEQVWAIDPVLPIKNVGLLEDVYAEDLATQRFNAFLLGGFASIAVLLALVGTYGVLSYIVGQRTHEIGIRMALGARRNAVVSMIAWHGMRMVLAGVGLGVAGAVAVARFIESLLYEVSAVDPVTYLAVSSALVVVAGLACLIPALRASRLDAMEALRRS